MTDFLYPFIDRDETDAAALLADLASSARSKTTLSASLRDRTVEALAPAIDGAAREMVDRFRRGGTLLTFGNGGSSTDAAALASLFTSPDSGEALPASALVADPAVLTALGNDVGFDLVFSRQLISLARPDDIALGLSTSGSSANLLRAFAEAHQRGMLAIGFAGYDGGEMRSSDALDHCLVVRSDSVHRIQETQASLAFALWQRVQAILAGQVFTDMADHGR